MNKEFFKGMKSFATGLLVIGWIAVAIMAFTTIIVSEPSKSGYSSDYVFSWGGLISSVIAALGVTAGYYILKGIALIGLREYEEDQSELAQTISEQAQNWKYANDSKERPSHIILDAGLYLVGDDLPEGAYYAFSGYADKNCGSLTIKKHTGEIIIKYELSKIGTKCVLENGNVIIIEEKIRFEPQEQQYTKPVMSPEREKKWADACEKDENGKVSFSLEAGTYKIGEDVRPGDYAAYGTGKLLILGEKGTVLFKDILYDSLKTKCVLSTGNTLQLFAKVSFFEQ